MTGLLQFANNANTTLSAPMNTSQTNLSVTTGTGALFPPLNTTLGQYFVGTLVPASSVTGLPCEIVHITAISGDTMTVVRAQEGTTALTWSVGDTFSNLWTAGQAETLAQQSDVQQQAGNFVGTGGSANALTATLNPAPPSLASLYGVPIRLAVSNTNTGPATLNLNGFGAQNIAYYHQSSLWAGAIEGGAITSVIWDGNNFELQTPAIPPPNSITNAALATAPSQTTKGNPTGSTGAVEDVSTPFVLAATGYETHLSGRTVQWGTATAVPNDGTATVSFSIEFPTACIGVQLTIINPTANIAYNNVPQLVSKSRTGCVVMNQFTVGTAQALDIYWEANGY